MTFLSRVRQGTLFALAAASVTLSACGGSDDVNPENRSTRYGDVQGRFEELDGYALEGRAREVLAGLRIATDIEDYALHVHEVMDGLDGFHNDGALTVSLPVEHVGKGNADEAAALRHADFAESERFDGRVLTNFEKKGLAAGRVIHDFTYRRV